MFLRSDDERLDMSTFRLEGEYSRAMPRRFEQNEGPSEDDIQRFGGADSSLGFCPECGAEISDLADICPSCHSWIPEGAQRRHPLTSDMMRRWYAFIGIVVLGVFLYLWLFRGAG